MSRARGIAFALATAVMSSSAHAEPTPADRVEARTLFETGRAAMKEGDYVSACPKLEQSHRLDPGIGTLYNLGRCYEGQGRLASAWTVFLEVAEAAQRAGQSERATAAKAYAATIEPRLPRLRVTLEGADHPTLTLDGSAFADALVSTSVPIDPGGHDLAADAPGKKHWSTHIEAAEAAVVTVSVPTLEDAPANAMPQMEPPVVAERPAPAPPPRRAAMSWHTPAAIVTGALGIVALGAGTVLGVRAINDWSDAKAMGCTQSNCPTPQAYETWHAAHGAEIASNLSFIAGGALVAMGAVIWFTRPKSPATLGVRSDGLVMIQGRFP